MIGRAVEKGLASLIARWMLDGHADAVLDRVVAAGALDAAEIEALRAQTRARLGKVRDDGAPYAALILEALSAVGSRARGPLIETASALGPTIEALLRTAARQGTGAARAAADADAADAGADHPAAETGEGGES